MSRKLRDHNLAKAVAHPLRLEILKALDGSVGSPKDLSELLDAPLGNTAYHVRQLHGLKLLRIVNRKPRRGAVETFYTALVRVKFSFEEIEPVKPPERLADRTA